MWPAKSVIVARHFFMSESTSTKYVASIQKLSEEFDKMFVDFRKKEKALKLFAQPIQTAAVNSADSYQIGLIYLQSDIDLKGAYSENYLATFHSNYVAGNYTNLTKITIKMLFRSTY